MPSHTIHSALIQIFFDSPGTPWNYPQWQDITGVRHGLFPAEDSLLPTGWSRETATFISSYFDQYNQKDSEDAKIKFAAGRANANLLPGRELWRKWVVDSWKTWKVHARITEILSRENLHPLTVTLSSPSGSLDVWPNGALFVPLAVDPVAHDLFGDECLNSIGRARTEIRQATQAIIQRTWLMLRNQVNRNKDRIVNLEKEAINAFDNLDRDKLTKAKIKAVIVKVARWKSLADVLHTKDNLDKMEVMEEELKRLMVGLGARLPVTGGTKGSDMTKVDTQMLQSLASEEDVADILNLYTDFFNVPSDSAPLQEQQCTIGIQFGERVDGADPGTEYESTVPPNDLARNLGFVNGLPFLFNTYRHRGGLSAWDPANADLFEGSNAALNPEMDRILLHWHQLCGVHSMIRMTFTATSAPDRCCGVLIADDVGLGKTFQAATTIAFLSDLRMRQMLLSEKKQVPLPPIIQSNAYLREHVSLPDLPHLIVVPGTLLSQWQAELKTVFKPKSIDILMYGTGKALHDHFWSKDGPFHTSNHRPSNRIIIASHSALQQDFSLLYAWTKPARDKLPWQHPSPLFTYSTLVSSTLYGQQYMSVTLDEAHAFRNVGPKHSSALLLLEKSILRFIMTATPLQTSTKDVAGMGRLLGLPHFHSEDALSEEKADSSSLRRAKDGGSEDSAEMRERQVMIAQRMQQQFEGRILRRTVNSLNWKKEPLITLPPYTETMVVVKPTPREMEIITELADRVKESVSTSNGVLMIVSRSFYIEHRMCVGYARFDLAENIPKFHSLDEWEGKKSTKFDTCARMCRHLLTCDDAPEIIVEGGTVVYPPIPPRASGASIPQETKILVYQEFPSLGPLLRNVLDLYGIRYMYIDGQTSFQDRAKIVKSFCDDPLCRVLIISSVGSTGLNLTEASVIIFLDQPWSAQDERQIRGRAYRQPQKKVVRCYHILADETADIILSSLARGKHDMLEAFLRKDSGNGMYPQLLEGKSVARPEDFVDETDPEYRSVKKEAKQATKRAEKEAKEAAKTAEKEAKEAAKTAEKEAKEAAREAAKTAKKAEKEARDAAKKAEKKAKESEKKAKAKAKGKKIAKADESGGSGETQESQQSAGTNTTGEDAALPKTTGEDAALPRTTGEDAAHPKTVDTGKHVGVGGNQTGGEDCMQVDDPFLAGGATDGGDTTDGNNTTDEDRFTPSDSEPPTDGTSDIESDGTHNTDEQDEPPATPPRNTQAGVRRRLHIPDTPETNKRQRLVAYASSRTDERINHERNDSMDVSDTDDVFGSTERVTETLSGAREPQRMEGSFETYKSGKQTMMVHPARELNWVPVPVTTPVQAQVRSRSVPSTTEAAPIHPIWAPTRAVPPPASNNAVSRIRAPYSSSPASSPTVRAPGTMGLTAPTKRLGLVARRPADATPSSQLRPSTSAHSTPGESSMSSSPSPAPTRPVSSAMSASSSRDIPAMRQPTFFRRRATDGGELAPPPLEPMSQNPFRKNGNLNKKKQGT
ncbi:Protein CHROMATIN REMODELING 5 [Hypsizygus marmoreus]|uniref:Protein CHROMATIN REMODELING 5 n=1 Tax=Hypsizygus marmoreus TaxID=39966 RepID=A0A369IZ50_HYPMA|nr:Protein CHROMATIN REMODELING 5 [Hypsizygus marmoreus]